VASQAVVSARHVVSVDPDSDALKSVVSQLESVSSQSARAAIVWLACEFCDRVPAHACEVLRIQAKAFSVEVCRRSSSRGYNKINRLINTGKGNQAANLVACREIRC